MMKWLKMKVSLWTVLNIPFGIILLVSASLIGFLSIQSGTQAANNLATQLQAMSTARVNQYLNSYLATPQLINSLNLDAIRLHQLDLSDPLAVEHQFMAQLQRFPAIASIAFASQQRDYVGISRHQPGADYLLSIVKRVPVFSVHNYATDPQGHHIKLPPGTPNADLTLRPWYKSAVRAAGPTWTPIFVWTDGSVVGLDAVTPVYSESGAVFGVLDVSLSLDGIGSFLQNAPVTKNGSIFIVDDAGLLVASSTGRPSYSNTNNSVKLLNALDFSAPVIKAAAKSVTGRFGGWSSAATGQPLHFESQGQRYLMSVTPYQNRGLRWWMVVATPESDFLAAINDRFRETQLLIVMALGLSIAIISLLSRWISNPILQLNRASKAIAAGDWSTNVPVSRQAELGELALSFNEMAKQLHNSALSAQSSEARLRGIFENSADAIAVSDQGGFVTYNPAFRALFGCSDADASIQVLDVIAPREHARIGSYIHQRSQGQSAPQMYETRGFRQDGSEFDMEVRVTTFVQDAKPYSLALLRDVTERKQLERNQVELATIVESSDDAIIGKSLTGVITSWNYGAEKIFGYSAAEAIGQSLMMLFPEDRQHEEAEILEKIGRGEAVEHFETVRVRKDGRQIYISATISPLKDGEGKVVGASKIARDITEQKHAEAAVKASEERFRMLIENASDIITVADSQNILRFVSPSVKRTLGYEPDQLLNRNGFDLIHPEDKGKVMSALQRALADPASTEKVEYRFQHRDGSWRTLESVGRNVPGWSPDGHVVVNSRDITETNSLEEKLRQAQKMEGIGQLTGGVAHDFNNLLTVVIGNSEVLATKLPDPQYRQLAELVMEAAERGAELVRQLLAFARQQPLEPHAFDLNALVEKSVPLIQRVFDGGVEFTIEKSAGVAGVFADPAQTEAAILNLCINARDAMPDGGKLTIATGSQTISEIETGSDVLPGNYVTARVTDTGTGIAPEVMGRIFEPFFTTKEIGHGSGLGLSMIYGFVKQSRGFLKVSSELGKGTTFTLYLPAASVNAEDIGRPRRVERPREPQFGNILVVEDNDILRDHVRGQLESLGYGVRTAANGAEALSILEQQGDIDLLFTDIVMPGGMNGRQLGESALAHWPSLRVLYTSGYASGALSEKGRLKEGVILLTKPYTRSALAEKVRAVLEGNFRALPASPDKQAAFSGPTKP